MLSGVLFVLLLRFVFLKVRRTGRPLWAPAVPAIGAAVLLFAALGQAASRESRQRSDRARLALGLERACGQHFRPTFADLPGRLTYRAPAAELQGKLRERFSGLVTVQHAPEGRIVTSAGEPVGAVFAVPISGAREKVGIEKGFRDGASEHGAAVRDVAVDGRRLIASRVGEEVTVLQVLRCEAFITVATDETIALRVHAAAAPR